MFLVGKAEGEGFEPSVAYATLVFKTSAIGHSATPPDDLTTCVYSVLFRDPQTLPHTLPV